LRKLSGVAIFVIFNFLSLAKVLGQNNSNPPGSALSSPSLEPPRETTVVTGTFAPAPLGEIDRSVSVIETSTTPLLFDHWTDYLQTDSSIDLRRRAPNGVQSDLSLRGSSFGETLILLDGFRMDDAQSGHHDLDLPLPTESLDRIEILRGAGSTLYGSDAIGGAVNFITADPTQSELRLSAGVGNFGINQQAGSFSFLAKQWDEKISAARDFSTGFIPDRDYRSSTLLSNTGIKTAWGRTLLLLAYGDKPYGANQFYGNFTSWERTKSWFAGIKQDLGANTEFAFGYRRHSDVFVLIRNHPEIYENNHITESWQAALRRKKPVRKNVTLFYGGEGDHDAIASNNLGRHARSRGAAYVDLDLRALSRFSLSLGAREEIFSGKGTQFTPTVGGGVWLKPQLRFRASVGRAYRLPTYTDLFYSDPSTVGNANLKPESAWSYEAGVQWHSLGRLQADATLLQNRERNVIDYVKFFSGDINHAANIQKLNFTGIESSLKARLSDSQMIDLSYTWIHGTQQALSRFASSQYVFNYPINNAVIGWQGRLHGGILARTRIGVAQRFDRNPYAVWDADLVRHFGSLGLRLSLSNLVDIRYQEVAGVNNPGRSALVGVEYVIRRKK
jgi:iron complex outermembrane receptor protein